MTAKVLIVEDEDIIRSAVRKLLQHAGYEVADAVSTCSPSTIPGPTA